MVASALATTLTLPEFLTAVGGVKDEDWKHIRDAATGNTVLHAAAATRRTDVLRWLLEPGRGVAVNALNKQVGRAPQWGCTQPRTTACGMTRARECPACALAEAHPVSRAPSSGCGCVFEVQRPHPHLSLPAFFFSSLVFVTVGSLALCPPAVGGLLPMFWHPHLSPLLPYWLCRACLRRSPPLRVGTWSHCRCWWVQGQTSTCVHTPMGRTTRPRTGMW